MLQPDHDYGSASPDNTDYHGPFRSYASDPGYRKARLSPDAIARRARRHQIAGLFLKTAAGVGLAMGVYAARHTLRDQASATYDKITHVACDHIEQGRKTLLKFTAP